jgi:hypothetical protein
MLYATGSESQQRQVTIPQSPKFKTKERNEMKVRFQSMLGNEEMELKQHQFKAREFDPSKM